MNDPDPLMVGAYHESVCDLDRLVASLAAQWPRCADPDEAEMYAATRLTSALLAVHEWQDLVQLSTVLGAAVARLAKPPPARPATSRSRP